MVSDPLQTIDHPIFLESIRLIKSKLGLTGLDPLQQQVLERVIHSSGDFGMQSLIRFTPGACQTAIQAIHAGVPILTDTAMASAAVSSMASRTSKSTVRTILEWAPPSVDQGTTRSAVGMRNAWREYSQDLLLAKTPIVLIGSAPTALKVLMDMVDVGAAHPALVIGMPVGFIGVAESKERLSKSNIPNIRLEGTRGGAALAAAAMNALLRASTMT